ncbi:MAG: PIN domain-containing protein [Candidatus Thermoplasmatota archaeon]|nr:PIN domain-containing protein [Candidatus Thermoplasmatota archaeon]MBU4189828.1 PIN domain-containing protein [Candidatus Thermoplasmatota archaeon]MBU4256473.1 PIN domain-containing protein [Candidatus Thermoplasmatota archaeon]MCG2826725.1 PIN domain-containing protein [Thermoplasmatales archaeon]
MLVVDANVIISCLLKKGTTFDAFLFNSILKKFQLFAPEFLWIEVRKHKEELLKETKLPRDEFDEVMEFLMEEITVVSSSQFLEFLPEAKKILSEHPKDVPYLALALKLKCPIFSGDKVLKRLSLVKVLSPSEVLEQL